MRHEPLPRQILRRINLQKHEIGSRVDKHLQLISRIFLCDVQRRASDPDQFDLVSDIEIALVGVGKGVQGGLAVLFGAEGLSLVEEVVFGGDCSEGELKFSDCSHNYL